MNTISGQSQLKLSLSLQLSELLQARAKNLGIPVTQFVKHLIIKEVENQKYPTFAASDWTQMRVQKAMGAERDATVVNENDLHEFFDTL